MLEKNLRNLDSALLIGQTVGSGQRNNLYEDINHVGTKRDESGLGGSDRFSVRVGGTVGVGVECVRTSSARTRGCFVAGANSKQNEQPPLKKLFYQYEVVIRPRHINNPENQATLKLASSRRVEAESTDGGHPKLNQPTTNVKGEEGG